MPREASTTPESRKSAGQKSEPYGRFLDHHALVELARGQHGVVSLPQLKPLGIAARVAQKRAAKGQLHRIHRGVYSLVPLPLLSIRGRFLAAVLACGPGAAVSHRSAAALRDLRRSDQAVIEVTVPHHRARSHRGVRVHRSTTLTAADVTTVDGIPDRRPDHR